MHELVTLVREPRARETNTPYADRFRVVEFRVRINFLPPLPQRFSLAIKRVHDGPRESVLETRTFSSVTYIVTRRNNRPTKPIRGKRPGETDEYALPFQTVTRRKNRRAENTRSRISAISVRFPCPSTSTRPFVADVPLIKPRHGFDIWNSSSMMWR